MAGSPTIVNIVSAWTGTIVVEGCSAGTSIEIQMFVQGASAAPVATGVSQGGRDFLGLIAGTRLIAEATLRVASWDASQPSVTIAAAPVNNSDLPAMVFSSTLYECAAAVQLTGGFPGAWAYVLTGVGAQEKVLGSGRVGPDGQVQIRLTTAMPSAGTVVYAVQGPPAGFQPLPAAPGAQAVSALVEALAKGQLPKLTIPGISLSGDLPGCATIVPIKNAVPGAIVRGAFGSGVIDTWLVFASSDNLELIPAAVNVNLSLVQEFPNCERHPASLPADVHFGPAIAPLPPTIGPLCAGVTQVPLSGLKPGANLTLKLGSGEVLQYTLPPDDTSWSAPVPSLPAGILEVTEEACGLSATASVDVMGSSGSPMLEVAGPVYRCGRSVAVHTGQPGMLSCWANTTNRGIVQRSADVFAGPGRVVLDIFPALGPDDVDLWAQRSGCGGVTAKSPAVLVHPNPGKLAEASVSPYPVAGDMTIDVIGQSNAIASIIAQSPGQLEALMGTQELLPDTDEVNLAYPLQAGQEVWALLRMCQASTDAGIKSTVLPAFMVFSQPTGGQPLQQIVAEGDTYAPLIITKAVLTVYANGAYTVACYANNENSATDVSFDFQIQLMASNGQIIWSANPISGDLAAADDGVPNGLAVLGVPAAGPFSQSHTYAALSGNRQLWDSIVNASPVFISNNLLATPYGASG